MWSSVNKVIAANMQEIFTRSQLYSSVCDNHDQIQMLATAQMALTIWEVCLPAARAGAAMKMDNKAFRPIMMASQLPSELMSSTMRLPTAKSAAPRSAMVTQICRTKSYSMNTTPSAYCVLQQ